MEFNESDSLNSRLRNNEGFQVFLQYHSALSLGTILIVISGNTLTIAALCRFPYLRIQRNVLIGSLAVSDLCVGINVIIWFTYQAIERKKGIWDPTDVVAMISFLTSYTHIIMISVDRFLAIMMPLRYPALVTRRVMSAMIGFCWGIPIVFMLPLYIHTLIRMVPTRGNAYFDKVHLTTTLSVCAIFLILMFFLYGKILKEARAQAKKIDVWVKMQPTPENPNKNSETNKGKGTRVVMAILSVCFCLTIPYMLYATMKLSTTKYEVILKFIEYVGYECFMANSAINVFIYAASSKDFRRAYRTMLCACCTKSN